MTRTDVDYRDLPPAPRELEAAIDGEAIARLKRFAEAQAKHVRWSIDFNHYSAPPGTYRVAVKVDHLYGGIVVDPTLGQAVAKAIAMTESAGQHVDSGSV